MRIAMVAPLVEAIPPRTYGGTERAVHWLTEELVRLCHRVTLYAAPGSKTAGHLAECGKATFEELGIPDDSDEARYAYSDQLKTVFSHAGEYDVIHIHHMVHSYHPDVLQEVLKDTSSVPILWTEHNELLVDGKPDAMKSMGELGVRFIALSESQRNTFPDANWSATIGHGLPVDLYAPGKEVTPSYLAFLGRLSPEKGIIEAVKCAQISGLELKVAAKVDEQEKDFYENEVKPLLRTENVEFVDQVADEEKGWFLSGAIALMFLIGWSEPFGLVIAEAMACGCPIIAYREGSVGELVEDGVTGFLVGNEEEAAEATKKCKTMNRERIRKCFEERFTSSIMAEKHLEIYAKAMSRENNSTTGES